MVDLAVGGTNTNGMSGMCHELQRCPDEDLLNKFRVHLNNKNLLSKLKFIVMMETFYIIFEL
jgi:hypothetical protein